MIANLVLHPHCFQYNGKDTLDDVRNKVSMLINDVRDIVYNYTDENVFWITNDFCKCNIFQDQSVVDFVCNYFQGEEQGLCFSILANEADTSMSNYEELSGKCNFNPSEKEVWTMLVLNAPSNKNLNPYIQFERYEIVYCKASWLMLRRQILGNHPGTSNYFIEECKKYFDKLYFHDNCKKSLNEDDYLSYIPRKIVYYLSVLNDCLSNVYSEYVKGKNVNTILGDFSGRFGLDEVGSLQGNPDKKKVLSYHFPKTRNNNESELIYCEPHLKICSPDTNCSLPSNPKICHSRIYFAFCRNDVANNKHLIGSIGPHA